MDKPPQNQNDDLQSLWSSLPADLFLRIICRLPSPLLFECRILSKAVHAYTLRTLTRRPFFVYQKPSSECFLLPLDTPSKPLPCSVKLGTSSFTLFSTSANLICLQRRYKSMLDVCVCSIFCKWKITLPPIVHPSYSPRLLRRVFTEDSDVDSLELIDFEALQDEDIESSHVHGNEGHLKGHGCHVNDTAIRAHGSCVASDAHGIQRPCDVCRGSHIFRIVAVNKSYARVFDSRQQEWSNPLYHPADVPLLRAPSKLMIAGFPARVDFNSGHLKLRISFPTVEAVDGSMSKHGLVLERVIGNDQGPSLHPRVNFKISDQHYHSYARHNLYNALYIHHGKVYILLIEKEGITCFNRDRPMRQRNTTFHRVQPEDVKTYLLPTEGVDFACQDILPALTPCMLTLYIADVDTINWKLQLKKENATDLLKLCYMWDIPYKGNECNMGMFLLIKGIPPY